MAQDTRGTLIDKTFVGQKTFSKISQNHPPASPSSLWHSGRREVVGGPRGARTASQDPITGPLASPEWPRASGEQLLGIHFLDKKSSRTYFKNNIKSSLNDSNKSSLYDNLEVKTKNKSFINILFDPQTAGGFLFITSDKSIILDLRKNNIIFSEIGNITSDHNKIRVL